MNKRFLVAAILVLGLLVSGCNTDKQEKAAVVAEVNGDKITQVEFDQHLKLLKYTYEKQVLGEGKLDESKDKEIISQLEEQTYNEMILQKLILQEADKQNIKVEESEIEEMINGEDLSTYLKESGMEEKYFRQEMKTQLIYWEIRDKVTSDISVNEEEARKYYDENIHLFTQRAGMQLAHILVDTEQEAKDILVELNAGGDFAQLAQKYSTCPSKEQGGYLGIINEDSNFVTEFKEAALAMQPGELSQEPVKSEFGFHIIKTGDMVESKTNPFEEVKDAVTTELEYQKKDEAYAKYLGDLKEKSEIKDLRK